MYSTRSVLEAIYEAECFLERLAYYWEGYLIGSIGMNKFMREIHENLKTCWDFKHLVTKLRREHHYRAFFAVCEKLRPTLNHTMWPGGPGVSAGAPGAGGPGVSAGAPGVGEDFRFVTHAMPALRGTNGFFEQYRSLMQRVRAAGASRRISRGWWRIETVSVQPVMRHGALMVTLGQSSPWRFLSDVARQCLFGLIGEMVGWDRPGVFTGRPFRVSIGSLAAVGYGRTLRMARKTRSAQVFRGGVGSFASLACAPFEGKIVRVTAAETILDDSAVAASLLGNKFFTAPDESGVHCWHAVRVFHRSRMMRGPESSCERWGSLMHCLWDSVAGWGPHRIVSRLFIRESGLQGSVRDEAVVHEIALALRDRHGMDPYTKGSEDTLGGASVSAAPSVDLVVRRGLESGLSAEALRDQSCPSTLLDAGRAAVDKAVREGHAGVLAPLPMFVEDARTASKRRAVHAVRDSVAQWLGSSEAADWRRDRRALFPGAAAPAPAE